MNRTKTISVTSGKGGVGKTTLVCNLAVALRNKGKKVLILDGDLGMANVDIFFGVRASRNIQEVLNGKAHIKDIIVEVDSNISLIPGGSGIYGLSHLSGPLKQILLDQVSELNDSYDYMLVDTAPGIEDHVLYLNSAAQKILVTVTPDPASITDAYAIMKVLHQRLREDNFSIICNMVKDEMEARQIFHRLSEVASHFLCIKLDYMGFVPMDLNLRQSSRNQDPLLKKYPQSTAGLAIQKLSEKLSHSEGIEECKGGLQFFWQQLSGVA